MADTPEPAVLWRLSRLEFNEWRRQNDLPELIELFKTLPRFADWEKRFAISENDIATVDHTSDLFIGESLQFLVDATHPGEMPGTNEQTLFVANRDVSQGPLPALAHGYAETIHSCRPFVPYFAWLRDVQRTPFFRTPGDRSNQFVSEFEYQMWQDGQPTVSRAHLFSGRPVLKLGGTKIQAARFDGRNLDFVDLDGLVVKGRGSNITRVTYSSCRGIRFEQARKAFVAFRGCSVVDLVVSKSDLQDLTFTACKVGPCFWSESKITGIQFERSSVWGIESDNCELRYLSYDAPGSGMSFESRADLFKRLRFAFQQRGNRSETAYYYYRERMSEMLATVSPLVPFDIRYPQPAYRESYRDLLYRYRAGQFTASQVKAFVRANVIARAKLLMPPYIWRLCGRLSRFVRQALEWAIWGFGERPARVFPWMIAVLAAFTVRYYVHGGKSGQLHGKLAESFYCSAFNFATMGCDDKTSFDSIEGVLGAVLLGIMVAGFANRSRY
jgi:hypothetical protein